MNQVFHVEHFVTTGTYVQRCSKSRGNELYRLELGRRVEVDAFSDGSWERSGCAGPATLLDSGDYCGCCRNTSLPSRSGRSKSSKPSELKSPTKILCVFSTMRPGRCTREAD